MFGLACVILPFSEAPPSDAITRSLARFQRGRRGDVPDEWLRFYDETATLHELHQTLFSFSLGQGLSIRGGESWYLSSIAVREEMERRGRTEWTVRLRDVEPDFDCFVERFTCTRFERHPITRGHGRWLNGLGEWDYWELGGCFDGQISGEKSRAGRKKSLISSGPSSIRDAIDTLEDALCDAFDQDRPIEVDVHSDVNVELVRTLLDDLVSGQKHARPGVIVLPPGSAEDSLRWIKSWPERSPRDALEWLGVAADSDWLAVLEAAYRRFPDHWAAGVAFHF
jgi:hypothetical protein